MAGTVVYSVMFFFITLSFQAFFYFLPDMAAGDVRPLLLVLYQIAWPIAIVVPPLVIARRNQLGGTWTKGLSSLFLVSVLLWPVITLLIKIRSLAAFGQVPLEYWGLYPVFILLEIIWPLANLVFWFLTVQRQSEEWHIRRELKLRAREEMRRQISGYASERTARRDEVPSGHSPRGSGTEDLVEQESRR